MNNHSINDMGSRQSSQLSNSSHHRRANGGMHHSSNGSSSHKSNNSINPSIWTTNTSRSSSKSNFTSGSNDFHFIQASDINTIKSSDVQNGSTAKLLPYGDDQSNSQVSLNHIFSSFFSLFLHILKNHVDHPHPNPWPTHTRVNVSVTWYASRPVVSRFLFVVSFLVVFFFVFLRFCYQFDSC